MGVNMGFNTRHHHDEPTPAVHIHKNGKVHEHQKEKAHNHHKEHSDTKNKDNCCNDQVVKLQSSDKAINPGTNSLDPIPVILQTPLYSLKSYKTVSAPSRKYIIPTSHPPPQDIRVLIQSFLI